jgi:hypothetical protein
MGCSVKKRDFILNGHSPEKMRNPSINYQEYVREPDIMIKMLSALTTWIDEEYAGGVKDLVLLLMDLEIEVGEEEVVVKTIDESLRRALKNVIEEEGEKFRTRRI